MKYGTQRTDPINDGIVEANIVVPEGVTRADLDAFEELAALIVLKLFGEGSEALFEILELLQCLEIRGFEHVVVLVGEVEVIDSQVVSSLQRYGHRIPRVVIVCSELQGVARLSNDGQLLLRRHCGNERDGGVGTSTFVCALCIFELLLA